MKGQQTIGIIGGGQLGRMLTLAAVPLGFKVVVINPTPDSPAAQVGAEEIVADLYDKRALRQLAKRADYITVEIEHLDTKALESIAKLGASVNPAPATIRLIQDKFLQKKFLDQAGVPVAPFREINDIATAEAALKNFGGRMLIKTRQGAYDGRGNIVVKSIADVSKALKTFADRQLYAEAFVPFSKELAVIIARSTSGDVKVYPVVQTVHARNICVEVLAPAPIKEVEARQAEKIARRVANLLKGAGVFAIEMFLTKEGKILINEIAPRVHNSGHHTIEATQTSQFEQHIRAVTGLPLGETSMIVPAAVTVNILGERNGPTRLAGLDKALAIPATAVHIYDKSPTKVDRKMGHITSLGDTIKVARARAHKARRLMDI